MEPLNTADEIAAIYAEEREHYADHMLTYHPPTPEQAPLYARIVAEVRALQDYMERIVRPMVREPAEFDRAGALVRTLFLTILEICPRGRDQEDAIRALRYVRNGINAHLHLARRSNGLELIVAKEQLLLCRWSACSAIALD